MCAAFTALHRGGAGTPLVCLHGFMDTWRTWSLVLPALEREHDVLALTLPGHAGGPPLDAPPTVAAIADAVERAMDAAGFATAHLVGSSLGGYLALLLAQRGRARTVVAFAPAGGWAPGDDAAARAVLAHQAELHASLQRFAPAAESLLATPEARARATADLVVRSGHLPAEVVADLLRGAAACDAAPLIEAALRDGWPLDPERVTCPVRIVWGAADRLLPWPSAATGYRRSLPQADWIELDDVGHAPQLDVPIEAAQLVLGWTAP